MQFNCKKFEILRYRGNKTLKGSTHYFTTNQEEITEEKENLRDFGIIMSNDGSFSNHVCSKVQQSDFSIKKYMFSQVHMEKFVPGTC